VDWAGWLAGCCCGCKKARLWSVFVVQQGSVSHCVTPGVVALGDGKLLQIAVGRMLVIR
jgi:hypothetical protein